MLVRQAEVVLYHILKVVKFNYNIEELKEMDYQAKINRLNDL